MGKTISILKTRDVLGTLGRLREAEPVDFSAFYSDQLGGVVTDPALMVLPFDDHMVHRGHGVFDTAAIVEGKIYDLDNHLDRFLRSAEAAKLPLPHTRDEMRDIVIQTSALSGRREGSIRYWISSGTGSLGLIPTPDAKPCFFVMIFGGLDYPERYYTEGMRVMTTTYPIKPPLYAITKSTNYLPNTLMQMEAKDAGFDNGVFIDEAGCVGEGSNMNCAFVTADGALRHPKFDNILAGCTVKRLLELAGRLVEQGVIREVVVEDIPVAEAKAAAEMMLVGSSIYVAPVVQWDDQVIGDGKPGPVTRAMRDLLEEDMRTGEGVLIEVPY